MSKFANNGSLSPERRLKARRDDARNHYGLSLEEADYLRSQPCEICGELAKKMCIDHKIPKTYRGVLCQQCNTRLGWFEKYREVILDYAERGPQNAIDKVNK
jgi:hypothetical protein